MSKPKDRTLRTWRSGDGFVIQEREAHGKHIKGYKRKWSEQRVYLTLEEMREFLRIVRKETPYLLPD